MGWNLGNPDWPEISVSGRENLDPSKTYVFVANHTNMLDIPMVGSRIYHPWVSLIKKELKYIPLVGNIISLIAIPVDRSNAESRKSSLLNMVKNSSRRNFHSRLSGRDQKQLKTSSEALLFRGLQGGRPGTSRNPADGYP